MVKSVSLHPRISEKTYALAEKVNTYVFEVPSGVNKHSVAQAVAAQHNVQVLKVRLASLPGKKQRSVRRGGRSILYGKRSAIRKAYVTLAADDKLPIFSALEEAGNQAVEAK